MRQYIKELKAIHMMIADKKTTAAKNPLLTVDQVKELVDTSQKVVAADMAIKELNLIITQLKLYVAEAWNKALLVPAAAGAALVMAANIQPAPAPPNAHHCSGTANWLTRYQVPNRCY